MPTEKIAFDHELGRGIITYNEKVGRWWFRVVASRYSRSRVIKDVHHQSEDESDKIGGYFITALRAL